MLRLGKTTDYALVVLTHMVRLGHVCVHPARDVADATGVPLPTVQKVMKVLTREGLTVSLRGARGGYALAKDPAEVTLLHVIEAMEGPVGLTDCATLAGETCEDHQSCTMSGHWPMINRAVRTALGAMTILDVSRARDEATPWPLDDETQASAAGRQSPTEG